MSLVSFLNWRKPGLSGPPRSGRRWPSKSEETHLAWRHEGSDGSTCVRLVEGDDAASALTMSLRELMTEAILSRRLVISRHLLS